MQIYVTSQNYRLDTRHNNDICDIVEADNTNKTFKANHGNAQQILPDGC